MTTTGVAAIVASTTSPLFTHDDATWPLVSLPLGLPLQPTTMTSTMMMTVLYDCTHCSCKSAASVLQL